MDEMTKRKDIAITNCCKIPGSDSETEIKDIVIQNALDFNGSQVLDDNLANTMHSKQDTLMDQLIEMNSNDKKDDVVGASEQQKSSTTLVKNALYFITNSCKAN
eukprot:42779_1